MMKAVLVLIVLPALALGAANPLARRAHNPHPKQDMNVVELAQSLGLNELARLLTKAGLVETLQGEGPFTVFGPTDAAFEALGPALDDIEADEDFLRGVLLFHVHSGMVMAADLSNEDLLPTLAGPVWSARINIYDDPQVVTVQGVPVVNPDQVASNGVIHVVERVVFGSANNAFEGIDGSEDLETLSELIKAADVIKETSERGPYTFLAPTDEAFEKLPDGALEDLISDVDRLRVVLAAHVVPYTVYKAGVRDGKSYQSLAGRVLGNTNALRITTTIEEETYKVNGVTIIAGDFPVRNGVLHVLDSLLPLPESYLKPKPAEKIAKSMMSQTLKALKSKLH